jgi:F0F1-type ATP synthase membrane subunit c/vacuolar-type H+-ATPase subunit K
MSTGRLTTTDGAGAIFGAGAGTAGLGAAGPAGPFGGAAIFAVAALPSLFSGTRFEKVLIEDF